MWELEMEAEEIAVGVRKGVRSEEGQDGMGCWGLGGGGIKVAGELRE